MNITIDGYGRFLPPFVFGIALAILVQSAAAVDIVDERKDAPKVIVNGDSTIIETPSGWTYTLQALPDEAIQPKFFTVIPAEFKGKKEEATLSTLSLGDEISRQEVIDTLDAYLREVAFDYDSIKLRKLEISQREYAAWCGNYLVTCLSWQFRSGSLVTFEENGRNRNGGMTGFQPKAYMVRKVKTGEAGAPPPAVPGTLFVVTASTGKPPGETLQIARQVLEGHGYQVKNVNEAEGTLVTSANPGLLTTKNADCGKYFGLSNLGDKRAHSEISIAIKVAGGNLELSSSSDAVFKTGYGAADRPLVCRSKGILENELLDEMKKLL
jgi:hypothetical protein